MKTFNLSSYPPPQFNYLRITSLRNFFLVFCCIFLFSFSSYSMWVEGSRDGCSNSEIEYTVHDFPNWADPYLSVEVSAGNQVTFIDNDAMKFKIQFGNSTDFYATIWVRAKIANVTVQTETFSVHLFVSSPDSPNWGTILVCPNGPNVNLTTNQNMNCGFHCDYVWTAPSGINLRYGGQQSGQIRLLPQQQPVELLSAGVPNGHLGYVSVAAKWSECGLAGDTYGYAQVYSGPPILNPKVNGSPSQGFDCTNTSDAILSVDNPPGTNYTNWSVLGGNGNIYPSGSTCYAYPNNFLLIKVEAGNACGSNAHFYYLSLCGSSPYRIGPNPAETEITIDFEYKEFAEGLLKKIELLDLEGKSYYKTEFNEEKDKNYFKNNKSFTIDTRKFKRGNYVLHLDFGKFTDKKQIILK